MQRLHRPQLCGALGRPARCAVVRCAAARQSAPPPQPQQQQRAPAPSSAGAEPQPRANTSSARPVIRAADPVRRVAVMQLLAVEQEGAFTGLISGAVKQQKQQQKRKGQQQQQQQQPPAGGQNDDLEADDEVEDEQRPRVRKEGAELTPQQQRTLRSLVSGVVRWQRRLDYIASHVMRRSTAELDPPIVRQVLRLALYELLYADLAPHALGEFVDLTRAVLTKLGLSPAHVEGVAKLVNGVLRAAARGKDAGTLPTPERELNAPLANRELARVLGMCHSHPTWLVYRWLKRFGRETTVAMLTVNNRPPTYTVRANTVRTSGEELAGMLTAQGVGVEPCPLLPGEFLQVNSGLQNLLAMGHVAEGRCSVQDVSSGLVVALVLQPQPGERVLDCCAAPGGKTVQAAARMGMQGRITAVDVSRRRTRALVNLATSQGVPMHMLEAHAADFVTWVADRAQGAAGGPQLFDRVLLDAPCSGTGVLSKRADMRWRRKPEDITRLAGLQEKLLDAAAQTVRPGGLLVYSTCSLEPEECEEQVRAFLQRRPDFKLQPLPQHPTPAAAGSERTTQEGVVTAEGYLRTLPHVHGTDGMFAARLVRQG